MGRVYLEPVFAVNMVMNLLVLTIAGRLSGQRARLLRYLGASALGGLYAAAALLPFCVVLDGILPKVFLSVLMALAAWPVKSWLTLLKGWGSIVGVTAVGGGGALAAEVLLDNLGSMAGTVRLSHNALLLAFLGAGAMIVFSASALRRRGGSGHRVAVRVWFGGKRMELDGLLDTGNLLRVPFSGVPVMLLDRKLATRLDNGGEMVVVPFSTAGDGIATVRAVPADRVEVLLRGRWRNAGDMYLAASCSAFAGGVDALLPPAVLE